MNADFNNLIENIFADCLAKNTIILGFNDEYKPEHKGKYVITGLQMNNRDAITRIGKLVQVRPKSGAFGTELCLIRHLDDRLIQHENQSIYLIPEKYTSTLNEYFKDVQEDDADKEAYSTCDGQSKLGFIVME
ncbi:Uncharacterised protein [Phocoenobacter uteri]|uniref:Uncharacterized protein n=1 Tax=Phocoenobacter uteri TaxID=146806 RepID=A0A379CA03_9PAST|nr:hypothetical protein [Phocoenobacter uteri]MDG6880972.1 hypothetical protein [Phocoenobacter uteri]SUB58989.1 Uncharacterised protein [Phocoenobacter uteri]